MFFNRDKLFKNNLIKTFNFEKLVGRHFQDMLYRSIPNYSTLQHIIVDIAQEFLEPNTLVYDLGCSHGNTMLALRKQIICNTIQIIGVDNSKFLCELANKRLKHQRSSIPYRVICQSIEQQLPNIAPCSVIICSLTLHFLSKKKRESCIKHFYEILKSGSALILIEKTKPLNPRIEKIYKKIHRNYRNRNHYSNEEMDNKTSSLKKRLFPVSSEETYSTLQQNKFKEIYSFWKCCEFEGWLAIK